MENPSSAGGGPRRVDRPALERGRAGVRATEDSAGNELRALREIRFLVIYKEWCQCTVSRLTFIMKVKTAKSLLVQNSPTDRISACRSWLHSRCQQKDVGQVGIPPFPRA